uniref:Protein CIP2A n=1 Tax=Panagrellus redivivus TaxID=6233 RepID=A0A7E4W858_PANRE
MVSGMSMDVLAGYFQRGHICAVAFYSEPGASQTAALTEILSTLVRETSTIDPTGRLQVPTDPVQRQNSPVLQFVHLANELLTFSEITPSLRSKLQLLFFNLCQYNVRLRRFFAGELNLVNSVCFCLKVSLQEQLGPQNLIDILRLLQVLTYEKCLTIGGWLNDLLAFLLNELIRTNEAEWLPYCVAILSNLVSRSKRVSQRILKNTTMLLPLKNQLRKFLSHSSQTVVVSSIVLVGYLNEETRDVIFAPTHISETFFCVFNVIKGGGSFMTRHVAIDLLRRLIIADNANVTFAPTLSTTAKNLTTYEFFTSSIQDVASQLVVLDYRTEECMKIYEFLIAVCGLAQLRSPVCQAILRADPNQKRLTTPILAMSRTAAVSFEEAIDPEAPLLAAELLTLVLKEAVDLNLKIHDFVPTDVVIGIVRNNVKTPIETKSEYVSYQCRRITAGLRLADAISGDEHIRAELFEAITAPLCGHVNESQLLSNPIIAYMSKPPGQRGVNDLPDWSRHGVTIPLELLQLLASLKDYNKAYKELYWRSLKDERLIPFLAYAISYGDASTVFDALTLFTHCTQLQDFRTKLLSDLIASCALTKSRHAAAASGSESKSANASLDNGDGISLSSSQGSNGLSAIEVDRFLDKLRSNLDHHEPKLSQIVQIFEKKIAHMTERQRFLENTIKEKEAALSEAHRQASTRTNNVDTCEMAKFRSILASLETKQAEIETEKLALQSEKELLARELAKQSLSFENLKTLFDTSRKTVESLQNDKAVLMDENQKEREVQQTLRDKFKEMTNKFDQATNAVFEKDRELVEMIERHEQLKREHEAERKRNAEHEAENARLRSENATLLAFRERMTKMINGEL